MKIKVNEKIDKYLDLARDLKKTEEYELTVILIVVAVLGMGPKCQEKRLEELEVRGRIVSMQTIAVLRSTRILRRV